MAYTSRRKLMLPLVKKDPAHIYLPVYQNKYKQETAGGKIMTGIIWKSQADDLFVMATGSRTISKYIQTRKFKAKIKTRPTGSFDFLALNLLV